MDSFQWRFISQGCIHLAKKKKPHFTSFMNFNHFGETQLFHIGIQNVRGFPFLFNLQHFDSTNK
jgi:hypothetical protein